METGGAAAETHCNTLQHTATHCNTLMIFLMQLLVALRTWGVRIETYGAAAETHCNTLQRPSAPCNALQHTDNTPGAAASSSEDVGVRMETALRCNTRCLLYALCAAAPALRAIDIGSNPQKLARCNVLQHTATHCNTVTHCPLRRLP